jgi:hypothetical protein
MNLKVIFRVCITLLLITPNAINAQKGLDSTVLKTAITLDQCIENQKKLLGKEVLLKGFCVGSTQLEIEKEGALYILELDNNYPNNKVSILVTEETADAIGFSRYKYHQKMLVVRGKLEKSKKLKDDFGNARIVLFIKAESQILNF